MSLQDGAPRPHKRHSRLNYLVQEGSAGFLGQGTFGPVYKCLNVDTGESVCMKVYSTAPPAPKNMVELLKEEITRLRHHRHPHIVKYLGTERRPDSCRVFMEYVPGGSLRSLIGQFGGLSDTIIRRYTQQVVSALADLHACGIVHGGLSIDHILVTSTGSTTGCVKLSGLGATWKMREGCKRTTRSDVWDLGMLVLEMANVLKERVRCPDAEYDDRGNPSSGAASSVTLRSHASSASASPPSLLVSPGGTAGAAAARSPVISPVKPAAPGSLPPPVPRTGSGRGAALGTSARPSTPPSTVASASQGGPSQSDVVGVRGGARTPFGSPDDAGAVSALVPGHLPADMRSFVLACLTREPARRPSASALLLHPFVVLDVAADAGVVSPAPRTPLLVSQRGRMGGASIATYRPLAAVAALPSGKELQKSRRRSVMLELESAAAEEQQLQEVNTALGRAVVPSTPHNHVANDALQQNGLQWILGIDGDDGHAVPNVLSPTSSSDDSWYSDGEDADVAGPLVSAAPPVDSWNPAGTSSLSLFGTSLAHSRGLGDGASVGVGVVPAIRPGGMPMNRILSRIAALDGGSALLSGRSIGDSIATVMESDRDPLIVTDGWNMFDPKLEQNKLIGVVPKDQIGRRVEKDEAGRTAQQRAFLDRWRSSKSGADARASRGDNGDGDDGDGDGDDGDGDGEGVTQGGDGGDSTAVAAVRRSGDGAVVVPTPIAAARPVPYDGGYGDASGVAGPTMNGFPVSPVKTVPRSVLPPARGSGLSGMGAAGLKATSKPRTSSHRGATVTTAVDCDNSGGYGAVISDTGAAPMTKVLRWSDEDAAGTAASATTDADDESRVGATSAGGSGRRGSVDDTAASVADTAASSAAVSRESSAASSPDNASGVRKIWRRLSLVTRLLSPTPKTPSDGRFFPSPHAQSQAQRGSSRHSVGGTEHTQQQQQQRSARASAASATLRGVESSGRRSSDAASIGHSRSNSACSVDAVALDAVPNAFKGVVASTDPRAPSPMLDGVCGVSATGRGAADIGPRTLSAVSVAVCDAADVACVWDRGAAVAAADPLGSADAWTHPAMVSSVSDEYDDADGAVASRDGDRRGSIAAHVQGATSDGVVTRAVVEGTTLRPSVLQRVRQWVTRAKSSSRRARASASVRGDTPRGSDGSTRPELRAAEGQLPQKQEQQPQHAAHEQQQRQEQPQQRGQVVQLSQRREASGAPSAGVDVAVSAPRALPTARDSMRCSAGGDTPASSTTRPGIAMLTSRSPLASASASASASPSASATGGSSLPHIASPPRGSSPHIPLSPPTSSPGAARSTTLQPQQPQQPRSRVGQRRPSPIGLLSLPLALVPAGGNGSSSSGSSSLTVSITPLTQGSAASSDSGARGACAGGGDGDGVVADGVDDVDAQRRGAAASSDVSAVVPMDASSGGGARSSTRETSTVVRRASASDLCVNVAPVSIPGCISSPQMPPEELRLKRSPRPARRLAPRSFSDGKRARSGSLTGAARGGACVDPSARGECSACADAAAATSTTAATMASAALPTNTTPGRRASVGRGRRFSVAAAAPQHALSSVTAVPSAAAPSVSTAASVAVNAGRSCVVHAARGFDAASPAVVFGLVPATVTTAAPRSRRGSHPRVAVPETPTSVLLSSRRSSIGFTPTTTSPMLTRHELDRQAAGSRRNSVGASRPWKL